MMYFCPQCGSKVMPGAVVCPQCGSELKFIIQSNGNNNLSSSYKTLGLKNKNPMTAQKISSELFDLTPEVVMPLKYNEYATQPGEVTRISDDDTSIIGSLDDIMIDETENEITALDPQELEKQRKIISGVMSGTGTATSQESSKYKIITQIYDKKFGFNAVELESKLNMYAKLGYQIVPNTMICQPGQDFFALMEKVVPTEAEIKIAEDEKNKKKDNSEEQ